MLWAQHGTGSGAEGREDKKWRVFGHCLQDDFRLTEAVGEGGGAQPEESRDGLTEKHVCTQPQGNWKSEAHSLILWAPAACQLGVGPCAGARGVVINETPPSSSPLSLRAN